MGVKKLKNPVVVTTVIENEQHEALRFIAFKEKISMSNLVRKSLQEFIKSRAKKYPNELKIPLM